MNLFCMANYQQAVPAVQKAIAVIEHLRTASEAPTLSELSRILAVNRSTMLAVLNTLRNAGWLVRNGEGRYRLGPAMLSFSPASAGAVGRAQQHVCDAGSLLNEAEHMLNEALRLILPARVRDEVTATEPWRGSHMGGLHGADLERFLALPLVASLACLNEDGYPYTVPVWYEWRDGAFWLVPRSGARWVAYVQAHPRVSMTISESPPPFRRVLIEGQAERRALNSRDVERRMAERYLGTDASHYMASRGSRPGLVLRISVNKLTSWEGLVAHPRYQVDQHTVITQPA